MADDDDLLTRAADNCAAAYRRYADAAGRPWRTDPDLALADLGLAANLPTQSATLRAPMTEASADSVVERVAAFFDGSPGGGYQIWSMWPTPDLSPMGFAPWGTPCMVRPAGGEGPTPPPELEIREAADRSALDEVGALVGAAFGVPPGGPPFVAEAFNTETSRVWLGSVDGRPVSTAAAVVSEGFCGVYAVATAAEARGRGYGAALSWAATAFRLDLPATLQASGMGKPVYDRLGYETVAWCHCWSRERRGA